MLEKSNMERLLEMFFLKPGAKMNQRDISRQLKIAPPTVAYLVKKMAKIGYLHIENSGRMKLISARNESSEFIAAKRVNNLRSIYESGIIGAIRGKALIDCIVVFGSYSRGEDVEGSDTDIAVISDALPKGKEVLSLKDNMHFEKRLGRNIHIVALKEGEASKEFMNNLANGIVVEGYLRLP